MADFQTFSLADAVGKAQDVMASRQAMANRDEMLQMEKEDRASRAQRQHMELFGKMAAGIMSQFDSLPAEQQTDETFHSLVQRQAEALRPYDPVSADRMAQGADRQAVATVARMYGYTPQSELLKTKIAGIQAEEEAKAPYKLAEIEAQNKGQYGNQVGMAGLQHEYALKLEEMRNRNQLGQDAQKAAQQAELEKLKENNKLEERTAALRKEWNDLPPVKNYMAVVPVIRAARDAVSRDTKAADWHLVLAASKVMDPISVVRESEAEMVAGTGTPVERVEGLLNALAGGAQLKPEVRKKLMAEVESRAKEMESLYRNHEATYRGIAASSGIDPARVFTDLGGAVPQAAPPGRKTYDVQNVQPQQDGSTIAVIDGQKLKFPPGQFEAWRQSHGLQ